jgi:superfamily II DNA or RNA helicase
MIHTFFSVLITEHRLWGTIFQPFALEEKNDAFYTIRELVTLKNCAAYSLSETEKKIVSLCNKYSEENMLKLFFRGKISIAGFQRKYEKNPQEFEHIPEFIDKCNYQVAKELIASGVPVFHRKGNYMNIYASDAVLVPAGYASHMVFFKRTSDFLYYSLRIYHNGKQVFLKGKKPVFLSNLPCCMMLDNTLFIFEKLDAKRISPFLKNEKIAIPKDKEAVYLKTFVLNTLKEEPVEATGFDIKWEQLEPVPVLTVLEDFQKNIALRLSFRYGEKTFSTEVLSKRQVTLHEEAGNYLFNVFERDVKKENAYSQLIEKLGFTPYNLFFHLKEKSEFPLFDTLEILRENKDKLAGFEINNDFNEKIYSFEKISLSTGFNVENDWFDMYGNVRIGAFNIPFIKFRKHILSGTREYVLPDKTVAILPEEWFTRFSVLFRFSEEKGEHIRLKKFYFGMMNAFGGKIPDKLVFDHEIEKEVPEGIQAELRSYQRTGFSWLVYLYENNFGGCLADDMGLGKTLQFLTFFQYIYKKKKAEEKKEKKQDMLYRWRHKTAEPTLFDLLPASSEGGGVEHLQCEEHSLHEKDEGAAISPPSEGAGGRSSLVILPTSLLHNWKNEKEKFAPGLSHYLYSGNKRLRSKEIGKIFDHFDLILTTYGTMRNDIEFLSQYEFECIVLDESQYIKNTSSQVYQSVSELKSRHFFVMTGTPIENSLNDLWAQLNFVNRGMLGSLSYFKNHFVQPIVNRQNEECEKRLQQIIKPFILRRTKSEVAKDLPPLIDQIVYCEMTEEQQKIYLSEKSAVRNALFEQISRSGPEKNTMLAISALLRLRQLANHPSLVLDGYAGESAKIEEVVSRIESLRAEHHKVLIFSSFVKLLQLVEARLQQLEINYAILTGETQNREEVVRRFQENPDVGCFLISLKAGGVGLNLTAADYVFILDPWWNPASELQAINRAHRIGQDKTVMVYRFISVDTIEEKIQNLQSEKSKLAETYINSNNPFADWKAKDLKGLFE